MRIDPQQWPTLSRLLDEALELSPEGRERWLESANLGKVSDAKSMLMSVIAAPQSTAQQAAECLSYRSTVAGLDNLSNTVDADHPMLLLARQLAHGWPPAGE